MESKPLDTIQSLYEVMEKEQLDSVELKEGKRLIKLVRATEPIVTEMSVVAARPSHLSGAHAPAATSKGKVQSPSSVPKGEMISSPLAGVFYRSSSPSNPPYVKEGDQVQLGQTLCIVEAMKVMNEIKAEKGCRILKILPENGKPVIAGQDLFVIE